MQIEVGSILEGKVTGITNFGAFVDLPDGKSGMVHISEISNTYVENVSDFLTMGQEVKVKVINITDSGKIALSIKKASADTDTADKQSDNKKAQFKDKKFDKDKTRNFDKKDDRRTYQRNVPNMKSSNSPGDFVWQKSKSADPSSFEDMMAKFKQQSDENMSSLKRNGDVVPKRPRRK